MSGKPRKDGGPAFPTEPNAQPGFYAHHGMSLRDYFAAKALHALIVGRRWDEKEFRDDEEMMERWATGSYMLADAMLRTREKAA